MSDILERASALEAFLRKENILSQADTVRDLLAETRRLEAALIQSRMEYLHTIDANPGCSAWDLDELSEEEQKIYREHAIHNLAIEEPLAYIQLDEAKKEAAKWRQIAIEERARKIALMHGSLDYLAYTEQAARELSIDASIGPSIAPERRAALG